MTNHKRENTPSSNIKLLKLNDNDLDLALIWQWLSSERGKKNASISDVYPNHKSE